MGRTRSEYRRALPIDAPASTGDGVVFAEVDDAQRDELAAVLLAAYRGTIDDEGETEVEAREAIDFYLTRIDRDASVVAVDGDAIVAFAFSLAVSDLAYVDPVVVLPDHKRTGLGRACVTRVLRRLRVDEVGATITDGNVASERLFASLGFERVGPWPPGP